MENEGMIPGAGTSLLHDFDFSLETDKPWIVIVWDDPVNLMTYVVHVFMKVLSITKERAHYLMMQVHNDGKSVVAAGTREEMERIVQAMHEHGLMATIQKDDASKI
jgi:ATP-dependent Clp protease adaptor protein ClpS